MRKTVLVLCMLAASQGPAVAQSDFLATAAIAATPIAALGPLMSPSMVGRTLDGAQLALRYGQRRDGDVNTFGVAGSAIFSVGLESSVSLTAGVRDASCAGCSPGLMLGIGGDMRVYEGGEIAGAGSGLAVSISGELGYGRALSQGHAYALGVGVPVTLSFASGGREGLHVVPFFTPVFGIGQTGVCTTSQPNCESSSATRWVLGGGIGVWNPLTSVSASVGVNHVMWPGGASSQGSSVFIARGERPVFGINVVFGGR